MAGESSPERPILDTGGEGIQPSIGEYGLIGDGRTAALCSSGGSIDWLCLPRFDSEPIFGRLIGGDRAGSFSLDVEDARLVSRRYRENSAVLETSWRTSSGEAILTEGMVLRVTGRLLPQLLLVRRMESRGGAVRVRVTFDPREGLTGATLRGVNRISGGVVCRRGTTALSLQTVPHLPVVPGEELSFEVEPGRPVTFAFAMADRQPLVFVNPDRAFGLLEETDRWWREWASRITYGGPHSGSVIRSLITLRLLIYSPSGAPVAAPTTSLPEEMGGIRNWDYRYSWARDASIGAMAFLATGLKDEAHSFLHWLLVASRLTRPRLQVVYSLDGKPRLDEREVPGAPGYRGSRPVRVGNEAATQHQLDVYGWVVDAAWAMVRSGEGVHSATWRAVGGFAGYAASTWRDEDAGIWEIREHLAHHVHSKLMGWLAMDRALRIALSYRTRRSKTERWLAERDALAADVRDRGFDPDRQTYVRSYGSAELDAALLILPLLEFDPARSPRVAGTIRAIRRELSAGGPFLYRYRPGSDGLAGREGAFLPCSFWLVQALARTGALEEAHSVFADLCSRSNDIGLYAEEMDPTTGEHLGNFPQALSHSALIQAALALQDADASEG